MAFIHITVSYTYFSFALTSYKETTFDTVYKFQNDDVKLYSLK